MQQYEQFRAHKAIFKKRRQKCILQCGSHMKPSFMITLSDRHAITCLQHPQALLHLHLHLLNPRLQVTWALLAEIQVLQEVLALQQIQHIQVP